MLSDNDFIATIRAHSESDGPRLVFADYLEENGSCARAEFVRVQIELAKKYANHSFEECRHQGQPHQSVCNALSLRLREAALLAAQVEEPCPASDCRDGLRILRYTNLGPFGKKVPVTSQDFKCATCHGEKVLRQSHACRWAGPLGGFKTMSYSRANHPDYWDVVWSRSHGDVVFGRFVRGFVGAVSLSTAVLVGEPCEQCEGGWVRAGNIPDDRCRACHGFGRIGSLAAELGQGPRVVTRVELSDKRPHQAGMAPGHFGWDKESYRTRNTIPREEAVLPDPIFDRLKNGKTYDGYESLKWYATAAAQQALSDAAVLFARDAGRATKETALA